MRRISVVVLARDEREVLCGLGELGSVQLVRTPSGPETAPLPAPDRSRELARCAHLLTRAADLRRSLDLPPPPEAGETAQTDLERAESDLRRMEAHAAGLLQRRQGLLEAWGRRTAPGEAAAGHPAAGLPLDEIARSPFLHFVTGTLPAGRLEKVRQHLGDRAALLPLPASGDRPPLLVALSMRHHRAALDLALREAGFRHEQVPPARLATGAPHAGTPRPGEDRTAAECARVDAELRAHAARVAEPLARLERWAAAERAILEAGQCCPRTEGAVLLTGWSAADDVPQVERRLREITGGRCAFEATEPADEPEDEIPVLLRPPGWLRPFESLVAGYGLPLYRELEPTLFVAISYILMFGMMFGDAGHGALLALAGLAVRLAARSARARDAGLLVMCAGASSAAFGVVYGSYFGIEAGRHLALWHDPLEGDPIGLMRLAIGFGVVMISLGLLLNIVNRMTRGDIAGGLLGHFGLLGLLFYWGALALVARYDALRDRGLVPWVAGVCLVLPALGWTLREPLRRVLARGRARGPAGHGPPAEPDGGFVAGLVEAATGAFEAALAFLANTISFVRLAAYAMSHAALLMATFVLAAEVERSTGGNRALAVVVVILGNAIALALEGVVAAIQALRLEYYEFFGKFFTGGGRPFRPFRLAARADA